MYTGLLHIHSLLRYIILILLLVAIYKAFNGWLAKQLFTPGIRKLNLMTLIFAHIQLLVGLGIYFISTDVKAAFANMSEAIKNPVLRFWSVEHIAMMVIAIALITSGYALAKKAKTDEAKHRHIAIFFLLALLVIFYAVPWPWSAVAKGWLPGME